MAARDSERRDIQELQRRIDRALRETPMMYLESVFAEFADSNDTLTARLTEAAGAGGAKGIEAALDEFDRLQAEAEDPIALRRALALLVTHHPSAVSLGLRLPGLAESAPWLAWPSKRPGGED